VLSVRRVTVPVLVVDCSGSQRSCLAWVVVEVSEMRPR
jgi:uncharacterized protein YbdZ (MbtH family)